MSELSQAIQELQQAKEVFLNATQRLNESIQSRESDQWIEVWLNKTDAAKVIGCSRQHIYNLDKQGILRGKLIGKKVYYKKSDCKRYKLKK